MGTRERNCSTDKEYIIKIQRNTMTANSKNYADVWKEISWKSMEKTLSILQYRIYKATKNNDVARVKQLQRLLIYSKASKFLAVKKVTQLNTGKRTPDRNTTTIISTKKLLEIVNSIRVHSSKKDDTFREINTYRSIKDMEPPEIYSLKNKALQYILKYALEPMYEAKASIGSYGCRPGKNAHDAQCSIIANIKNKSSVVFKRVLKVDVEKCFDKIKYSRFSNLIILPSFAMKVLKETLKIEVFRERNKLSESIQRYGIISSLVINIVLHGLEDIHNEQKKTNVTLQKGIRYINDLIFFLKENESSEDLLQKVKTFLAERGLNVKNSQSKILKTTEGFDFLDWTFKVKSKSGNHICYPSLKSRKNLIEDIKKIMITSRFKLRDRFNKARFIYKNWYNHHRYCNLSNMNLWSIKHWSYRYILKQSSLPKKHLKDDINLSKLFCIKGTNIN